MQKYTLTQVKKYTKDKDGRPLLTKDKRPYSRLNIQTVEYGDKWLSGFGSGRTDGWQAGDQVELVVTEKEVQGKKYLNFELPKSAPQGGMSEADKQTLQDIKIGVNMIQENMKHVLAILSQPTEEVEMPDFEQHD